MKAGYHRNAGTRWYRASWESYVQWGTGTFHFHSYTEKRASKKLVRALRRISKGKGP